MPEQEIKFFNNPYVPSMPPMGFEFEIKAQVCSLTYYKFDSKESREQAFEKYQGLKDKIYGDRENAIDIDEDIIKIVSEEWQNLCMDLGIEIALCVVCSVISYITVRNCLWVYEHAEGI